MWLKHKFRHSSKLTLKWTTSKCRIVASFVQYFKRKQSNRPQNQMTPLSVLHFCPVMFSSTEVTGRPNLCNKLFADLWFHLIKNICINAPPGEAQHILQRPLCVIWRACETCTPTMKYYSAILTEGAGPDP